MSGARPDAEDRTVVIGRRAVAGCYWRGVWYALAGIGAVVLGAFALSPNPLAARVAAIAAIAVLFAGARWLGRGLAPPLEETLVLAVHPDWIEGRQHGEVVRLRREDVWFVEVHELTRLGIYHLGIVGPDGRWRARWVTGWLQAVSTLRVCRQLRWAGYGAVLAHGRRVWWGGGVDGRAKAVVRERLEAEG